MKSLHTTFATRGSQGLLIGDLVAPWAKYRVRPGLITAGVLRIFGADC